MSALRSLTLFAAVLSACGGVDPGSGAPASGEGDGADRAAAEAELGRIQAALGEASCGSTAPDAVWDPNTSVGSVDGSYDHPTCRNGFVVDVPGATAGRQFTGGTGMRWPDPFTCLFWWGYLSLWQKQQSGTYVKISESTSLGVWSAYYPRIGPVCVARGTVQIPADGDYKLVAAAGVLFGPYTPVSVY